MGTNETAIWIGSFRVFQADTGSGIGKKWYVRQATYPRLPKVFDTQQAAIDYAVEQVNNSYVLLATAEIESDLRG